ncbi:MAG: glycosyltransferase family 4 protein [Anaerolineae bacterium]|nr:glycosyltransferase family 4 protein [Anaerolineae bacterium]
MNAGENSDRLKILIALLYYVPHRTGLTLHVQHVAEELVRRGHEVTVVTARYRLDLPRDEMVINGVRVVRLWAPLRMSRGMIMPAYPWAIYGLIRDHDMVWVNVPMLETALIAGVARLLGKKVVATHHGDLVLPRSPFNAVITWTMYQFYAFMARQASRLIAYSHDYAGVSYYLMPFQEKVSVVYPPVQIPDPEPEKVAALRAEWQAGDGPVIGYAGRFVQEKRPDLLIRALEVINRQYPNARVVFAGEYDIKYEDTWERHQDLVQQYRDQLIFLGLLDNMQDMANFYAACDVLVLPSGTECFGLVQVEAMLCGTPVIMTNIPGGRVVVQETGMGLIVPPGDYEAIGDATLRILNDLPAFVKDRAFVEQTFSFTETVDRYERHFRNAAQEAASRAEHASARSEG